MLPAWRELKDAGCISVFGVDEQGKYAYARVFLHWKETPNYDRTRGW
jgi:hypothetical protein